MTPAFRPYSTVRSMVWPLEPYSTMRSMASPLDVVAFQGATSDPVHHPAEVVSALVESVARGFSHVGCIRQRASLDTDATLIESTIGDHGNGVQTNPLGKVLSEYPPGSRAYLYRLLPEVRARLDLFAFYKLCGSCDGHVKYDIGALFRFLLPDVMVAQFEPAVLTSMVCSVWVATALETARATCGVTPWRMSPADVVALPIFRPPLRIL